MRVLRLILLTFIVANPWFTAPALAQLATPLPGGADVGRVQKGQEAPPTPALQPSAHGFDVLPSVSAPEQSKKIYFTLQHIRIEGMRAFTPEQIQPIYTDYLNKEITLDIAWLIAAQITNRYHDKGFFLSRAYVPKQQIENGTLRIAIVEGYISDVVIDKSLAKNRIVQDWIARIKKHRPITSDYLESALLQLNDIPGVSVRATLEPTKPGEFTDGAVRMVLSKQSVKGRGHVGFDNNGSRFLGPYQFSAQYETSFIPGQQTAFSFLTSTPTRELQYGTVKQHIAAFAGGYADLYGGYTKAYPGYTIRSSDIQSNSLTLGTAFSYQFIRQRQENLLGKIAFETRDTTSDISSTALTRDRIRALRASMNYETTDHLSGFNQVNITLSKGLTIFDASKRDARNLSRAQATPDFEKAEFYFARSQSFGENWGLVTSASGQIASGPLYSAEEFGYGGAAFGRAYDASEITGDHGIAASIEMRYFGLDAVGGMTAVPYGFYDAGAVFNEDRTQEKSQSASSAGVGVRLISDTGATANLAAAFPLTRSISAPLYGENYGPRFMFELGYGF